MGLVYLACGSFPISTRALFVFMISVFLILRLMTNP